MLAEGLAKLFGGIWKLKEICKSSRHRSIIHISNFLYVKALQAKGSWISVDAQFANMPIFPHGIYGIFISGGVSIGSNCIIFQQVTIGSNNLIESSNLGSPSIGDNCYIGAGAKIIGKIKVGNNVRVGANAVVVQDIPDNTVVTNGYQKIITKDYLLKNRYCQKYNGMWRCFDNGIWAYINDKNELDILESRFSTTAKSTN